MKRYAEIGRNMNIADKYFRLYLRNALHPYDLNAAEGTVLLMMYAKDGATEQQNKLIGALHYDKGVMTRTMKSLVEKGYVERSDNPADFRSHFFALTEKGRDFKSILIGALQGWNAVLLQGISEEELDVTEKALQTMADNAIAFYADFQAEEHPMTGKGKEGK